MNKDLAREIADLGITLTAQREDGSRYIVRDIEVSLQANHKVEFENDRLAYSIWKMSSGQDWSGFKDYLKAQMGGNMDKLTPYILAEMQKKYHTELAMNRLADKVADEYDRFISDIKQQSPERIVEAAYEIVQKDDIREYCSGTDYLLSQEQINDLLAADNLLDKLYNKWDELTDVHSLYDMDIMLEETASDLKAERLEREALKKEKTDEQPSKSTDMDKPAPPKPIKHSRR